MKSIYCDLCKRSYKINYIYTHRQKKSHLMKEKKEINMLEHNKTSSNIDNKNVVIFLEDVKKKIDNYLKILSS